MQMNQSQEIETPFEFGYEKCLKLYHRKWRGDDGQVLVPIGDFSDAHHSRCYRIFNATREIEAHDFDKEKKVKFQGQPDFEDIRAIVEALHTARFGAAASATCRGEDCFE
jgi:hypothetical protein